MGTLSRWRPVQRWGAVAPGRTQLLTVRRERAPGEENKVSRKGESNSFKAKIKKLQSLSFIEHPLSTANCNLI